MKDSKTALYAIAFILIGGLLASPSMQLNVAFADEDDDIQMTSDGGDLTPIYPEDDDEHDDSDYDDSNGHDDSDGIDDSNGHDDSDGIDDSNGHDDSDAYKYDDKDDYMRDNFDRYCDMTAKEREAFRAMHDKMTDEMKAQHDRYCSMTDEQRDQFMMDKSDMMIQYKKDHMMDRMGLDSVREFDMRIAAMCDMSDEKKRMMMQKYEFLQEHHERISEYCNMSEQEREDYRMTHQDMMEDFREDMGQMRHKMMDSQTDMKMHDMMRKYDMSDERMDVIKEKFRMKHADLTDVQRDEIRDKLKAKYMSKMSSDAMSDLQKDQILKRHAEMRDYKAELRLKYKDMSEDERIKFQTEFRDKVSDKRFAWISPHKQMKAGVPIDELECREGLNLVLKISNSKPLCVKSTTAEKLIEKGLAVPAA